MRFVLSLAFGLLLFTAVLAGQRKSDRVRIPEPDDNAAIILEFADSIEGTSGTPQGIAQKVTDTSTRETASQHLPQENSKKKKTMVRPLQRPRNYDDNQETVIGF